MSPAAQELSMSQIAPILVATVPRVVIPVGAEDADELVQDALVAACEAVHRLEKRGKQIIPKSVAYYTIQRLKSGRRSTGAGRTDVMSPGCQLDGNAGVSSLEEPVLVNEEDNENFTLGDTLASRGDDPAQVAVRNTDWREFMTMLDGRQQYIVKATAEGESYTGQAAQLKVSPSAITQRCDTIAKRARAFWGDSVLQDVEIMPLWRRQAQQR
jgi:DNA-directed RNA polymerase specialized sigma24 family protein